MKPTIITSNYNNESWGEIMMKKKISYIMTDDACLIKIYNKTHVIFDINHFINVEIEDYIDETY